MKTTDASLHDRFKVNPRDALKTAPLLSVGLVVPSGAGKTSLVEATARQLRGKARLGVITINPSADRDADRVSRYCSQVQAVCAARADLDTVLALLPAMDLSQLDYLLLDVVTSLDGLPALGQDVTVAVLSVGSGDDKATHYQDLLSHCDILILNKADLQRHVTFDRGIFWSDVRHINPDLQILEVSTFENRGIDRWLNWLEQQRQKKHLPVVPQDGPHSEFYIG